MPVLDTAFAQLQYELIDGPPDRPRLVFLHEGLGCIAMWKDFPRRLCEATGCPGLVHDRQGYGQSSAIDRPRTIHYLHHYALTELPAVIEQVVPGEPYIVIGHSDGGSIGLIHAAERPPRLQGLITEAAHVFVEDITLQGIRAAQEAYDAGRLRGLERHHGDKTHQTFHAWSDTWLATPFAHWNIEYLLPSVACPVLAMQGSDDQYGSPAQVSAIASKVQQGQPLMLQGCGHTPHLEQPDQVLAAMSAFVERCVAGSSQRTIRRAPLS